MHLALFGGMFGVAAYVAIDQQRTRRWLAVIDLASMLELADGQIDDPLRERLASGDIRLVRCAWLLGDEADSWLARGPSGQPLMRRRQELPEAALLSPDEAIALFNRADRSVLALSYRWLTAAHPDPRGSTLAAVRRYLRSDERLASCGLFWDVRTAAAPVRLPARHARVPGAQALVPIALPLTWRAPCASLCAAIRRPSHHRIATFRPAPAAAVCVGVPKGRERRAHGLRDGLL